MALRVNRHGGKGPLKFSEYVININKKYESQKFGENRKIRCFRKKLLILCKQSATCFGTSGALLRSFYQYNKKCGRS
jgi:hypothetical protein